jgi:hypothetical protein
MYFIDAIKIESHEMDILNKLPLLSAEDCHTQPDHSAELFAEDRSALKAEKAL